MRCLVKLSHLASERDPDSSGISKQKEVEKSDEDHATHRAYPPPLEKSTKMLNDFWPDPASY